VKRKPCPAKLDKRWYILLAKKRLRDKFGIDFPGDTLQLELDFGEPKPKPKKKAEAKPAPVPEQKYEFDIF
jgi:hypothetical protein